MPVQEYSTPEAADNLGVSPNQFRRLAKKRKLEPSSYYTNPHYRSGPECPKWSAKDLGRLKRTKDLKTILNRATPNPENAKRKRRDRFARKYATLEPLLVDACTALFNLNRYAKWPNCTITHRDEIYELKSELILRLHRRGFADRVYLHKQQLPEKPCFGCGGTGQSDWSGDECNRCNGTGIYLDAKELVFVVFSIVVAADEREGVALKFARHVVDDRGIVSDDEFQNIRQAGYTDGEIAEIVANVALNIFTNYFNHVAETEVDFPAAPELMSA